MSGSSRVSFPTHSATIPGPFLRILKMAVEDRPDLWDVRLQCLQTLWRGIVTGNHLGANKEGGGRSLSCHGAVKWTSSHAFPRIILILPLSLFPPLFLHSPHPHPPSLTSLSECSRRYCLLGLASISCRITGRYSCRLPALTLPRA